MYIDIVNSPQLTKVNKGLSHVCGEKASVKVEKTAEQVEAEKEAEALLAKADKEATG